MNYYERAQDVLDFIEDSINLCTVLLREDMSKCSHCNICVKLCPMSAIDKKLYKWMKNNVCVVFAELKVVLKRQGKLFFCTSFLKEIP